MPGLTIPRNLFKLLMAQRYACANIDDAELIRMIQGFLIGYASQPPWGGILNLSPIKDILGGNKFDLNEWRW